MQVFYYFYAAALDKRVQILKNAWRERKKEKPSSSNFQLNLYT